MTRPDIQLHAAFHGAHLMGTISPVRISSAAFLTLFGVSRLIRPSYMDARPSVSIAVRVEVLLDQTRHYRDCLVHVRCRSFPKTTMLPRALQEFQVARARTESSRCLDPTPRPIQEPRGS